MQNKYQTLRSWYSHHLPGEINEWLLVGDTNNGKDKWLLAETATTVKKKNYE